MQETQETWVQSLVREDPLEEGMATHSSILAWGNPWTEEPGYSPWGHKELDMTEHTHIPGQALEGRWLDPYPDPTADQALSALFHQPDFRGTDCCDWHYWGHPRSRDFKEVHENQPSG